MNAVQVHVQGMLTPEGRLELSTRPNLPAGPVEVLIRTQPPVSDDSENWWQYLERRRAELLAQGHRFRSPEEIDAELRRARALDEARRDALAASRG